MKGSGGWEGRREDGIKGSRDENLTLRMERMTVGAAQRKMGTVVEGIVHWCRNG